MARVHKLFHFRFLAPLLPLGCMNIEVIDVWISGIISAELEGLFVEAKIARPVGACPS